MASGSAALSFALCLVLSAVAVHGCEPYVYCQQPPVIAPMPPPPAPVAVPQPAPVYVSTPPPPAPVAVPPPAPVYVSTPPPPAPVAVPPPAPVIAPTPPPPAPVAVPPPAPVYVPTPAPPAPVAVPPPAPVYVSTPAPPAPVAVPTPAPVAVPPPYHGGKQCSIQALKLRVCANVLNGLLSAVRLGVPDYDECCPLLKELLDLDAAVCLCTAVRANVLGVKLDVSVGVILLLNHCGRKCPAQFSCPDY